MVGRPPSRTIIRTIDDLSVDQGEQIRRLYIDDRKTIAEVSSKMEGVGLAVVSKYLRSKGLKRTPRELSQSSLWQRQNAASYQEHAAERRALGGDDD